MPAVMALVLLGAAALPVWMLVSGGRSQRRLENAYLDYQIAVLRGH
jgi:hypothetical protein